MITFGSRASLYGQSDIAGYKPAAGDLAYPQKLEMMRKIEEEKRKEQDEERNREGEGEKEGQGQEGQGKGGDLML